MGIIIKRCKEDIVSNGNNNADQPSADAADLRTSFCFSLGREEKTRYLKKIFHLMKTVFKRKNNRSNCITFSNLDY